MQVGSLVRYVKIDPQYGAVPIAPVQWLPIIKHDYVIREMAPAKSHPHNMLVVLEEGSLGYHPWTDEEFGMDAECFVELQPPMSVDFLLEESVEA